MSFTIKKNKEYAESAYGELLAVNPSMRAQITTKNGFNNQVFSTNIAATTTISNGLFVCSSGTNSIGLANISTNDQVSVRAGQGLSGKISAVFDTGLANSTQFAGLITSENFIGFGYNGTDFGVVFATGGKLEIQKLTLTTPASGSETATVTINDTGYSVPLTAGDVQHNAYEIAVSLNSQVPGFNFDSNDDSVFSMALTPIIGGGVYSFSSSTAVGSFAQVQANQEPIETWVNQSNWNEQPNFVIDPTKGNEYKIQYPYLGFGNTKYYIKNAETGDYELVHIDKYLNKNTLPSTELPVFRCGWLSRNTGNTTNLDIKGAGASIEIEGEYTITGDSNGECEAKTISSAGIYHVMTIKNRMVYNNNVNRSDVIPESLKVSTESKKITAFYIYRDVVTVDPLKFQYVDESNSIVEVAKDLTLLSSGKRLACVTTITESDFDLEKYINKLRPQETISVFADKLAATSADISASISWKEDT